MKTDYSSPHREIGQHFQASQPRLRRPTASSRLFISKQEVIKAGAGHRWTMCFAKGKFIKRCNKCGKPAFAVEFDSCRGRQ